MPGYQFTPDQDAAIMREGANYAELARQWGCARSTVSRRAAALRKSHAAAASRPLMPEMWQPPTPIQAIVPPKAGTKMASDPSWRVTITDPMGNEREFEMSAEDAAALLMGLA